MSNGIKVGPERPEEAASTAGDSKPGVPPIVAAAEIRAKGLNQNVGIGCTTSIEPIPNFNKAECEYVIEYQNLNCQIVLGRDRPSDRLSGFGGSGMKRSFAIDLVAGRMGPSPTAVEPKNPNSPLWTENNFAMDAARIYISQRTNIDHNFRISSKLAPPSKNASGIGIKADSVRLVGRRDIKIVTGTDHFDSKGRVPGVDYEVPYKISLIGSNRDDLLQPMVKGENLQACLIEISETMHHILSTIDILVIHQNNINQAILNHTHISPFFGQPTTPSPDLARAFIPFTKLVTDVKSSIMELTGMIESTKAAFIYQPADNDANAKNILSNYNFCN